MPHSEQQQSALPDRFEFFISDGLYSTVLRVSNVELQLQSQGQRGLAVAVWNISFVVLQIQDSLLAVVLPFDLRPGPFSGWVGPQV